MTATLSQGPDIRAPGPSPSRAAAWEILRNWDAGKGPLEVLRDLALGRRTLSPADRALAMELTQGVARHLLFLDHVLAPHLERPAALPGPVRQALRLGAYQLQFLGKVPERAVVHEAVELVKGSRFSAFAPLVNAVLRKAAASPPPPFPNWDSDPEGHLVVSTSSPPWLVHKLVGQWGKDQARRILQSLNRPPSTALRVNTLRTSRTALMAELAAAGVRTREGRWAPDSVILEGGGPGHLAPFLEGRCTAQDEGAQLLAPLLAPSPGSAVLDACAAPGGKAGHLAQLMGDRGLVAALDLAPARLRLIPPAMSRLGFASVRALAGDALQADRLFPAGFPFILLDAPCTGTGVLRRHPEGKWRKDQEGLARLIALQAGLLDAAMRALRPGGRLLYTTCSLLREENEGQVRALLDRTPGVRKVPLPGSHPFAGELPAHFFTPGGDLRSLPPLHDCDGFFAALLERP